MRVLGVIVFGLGLAACDGVTADPGLDAVLQIPGAQYRPGPFPEATGGPAGVKLDPRNSNVIVGRTANPLVGILDATARGAVIGLEGYDGAWVLPAGPPSFEEPDLASVRADFAVADDFPIGPFTMLLAGADERGFGDAARRDLMAVPEPPSDGLLVVALTWAGRADLDLHVVDPAGNEVWSERPNSWQPPPPGSPPVAPGTYLTGGILDRDGNKSCRRDGRPREQVIWKIELGPDGVTPIFAGDLPPPRGTYTVRVAARSMCGDAQAAWAVAAYREDSELITAARGVALPDDTRLPHGEGAGVLAFRFDL